MKKQHLDLSIFEKFNFERKPVGVKFLMSRPDGIEQLEEKLALCEMFKEAQESSPFYAVKDSFECKAGPLILGMEGNDPVFESGQIGPMLGAYEDARANRRVYQQIPVLSSNSVNYVAFAGMDELSFEPDVFIVTASPGQAEIILRAASYRSGEMWHGKGTTVIGCAWLYLQPYVSGELNIMITGLYHGMKARNVFPEGLLLISIPFDLLPEIVNNLYRMEWYLPQFSQGKEAHIERMKNIVQELKDEN